MFRYLSMRNFRGFGNLEIPSLGRINLVTGKNNSGKTSLLEAFFMLCCAGNPEVALRISAFRGIDIAQGSAVLGTLWKPIFTDFDMKKSVEIQGDYTRHGPLVLNITLDQPNTIELPFDKPGRTSDSEFSNESTLKFIFMKSGLEKAMEGRLRLTSGGIQVDQPTLQSPIQAVFLSSRSGNLQEDAQRLGQLRQRKQGELVVSALRIVEPRLQSVEVNSASGVPMIWGDVGLPELVPLPMMGEGMTRIARLILAISVAPNGVVLVDEVENGLHHSVLGKVWKAIGEAARQFDTQVVASTHSFECMEAAYQSLNAEDFLVHRLENTGEAIRCITLGPDEIEATVEHNLEIR